MATGTGNLFCFLFLLLALCHVASYFPGQGSNPGALHCKADSNHWTTRKVITSPSVQSSGGNTSTRLCNHYHHLSPKPFHLLWRHVCPHENTSFPTSLPQALADSILLSVSVNPTHFNEHSVLEVHVTGCNPSEFPCFLMINLVIFFWAVLGLHCCTQAFSRCGE